MNKKIKKHWLSYIIFSLVILWLFLISKKNIVLWDIEARNQELSRKSLTEAFWWIYDSIWNQNERDTYLKNALYWNYSRYTVYRNDTCDTDNINVEHITNHDISSQYNWSTSLWQENTVYLLETDYIYFSGNNTDKPRNFILPSCSAVISKMPWWTTILDSNYNNNDALLYIAGSNIIIDNINIEWLYKNPSTQKDSQHTTKRAIVANQEATNDSVNNVVLNNVFISNMKSGWIKITTNNENITMGLITFYNNTISPTGDLYISNASDVRMTDLKFFRNSNYEYPEMNITESTNVSINNSYFSPWGNWDNIDINVGNNTNKILIDNVIWNIYLPQSNSITNCHLQNIVWMVTWSAHDCDLRGRHRYFNKKWLNIPQEYGLLTIWWDFLAVRNNLWCLTRDYIINPINQNINYYRYDWYNWNITSQTGCVNISDNWNTTPLYSNIGLKFSYWNQIPEREYYVGPSMWWERAYIFRTWDNIEKSKINFYCQKPMNECFIATDNVYRSTINVRTNHVYNDKRLVTWTWILWGWAPSIQIYSGGVLKWKNTLEKHIPTTKVSWPHLLNGIYNTSYASSGRTSILQYKPDASYWTQTIIIEIQNEPKHLTFNVIYTWEWNGMIVPEDWWNTPSRRLQTTYITQYLPWDNYLWTIWHNRGARTSSVEPSYSYDNVELKDYILSSTKSSHIYIQFLHNFNLVDYLNFSCDGVHWSDNYPYEDLHRPFWDPGLYTNMLIADRNMQDEYWCNMSHEWLKKVYIKFTNSTTNAQQIRSWYIVYDHTSPTLRYPWDYNPLTWDFGSPQQIDDPYYIFDQNYITLSMEDYATNQQDTSWFFHIRPRTAWHQLKWKRVSWETPCPSTINDDIQTIYHSYNSIPSFRPGCSQPYDCEIPRYWKLPNVWQMDMSIGHYLSYRNMPVYTPSAAWTYYLCIGGNYDCPSLLPTNSLFPWWFCDAADNSISTYRFGPFTVDTPDIEWASIVINNWAFATNDKILHLTLNATKTRNMSFSCNQSEWTEEEPYNTTKTIKLSDIPWCTTSNGTKTIYVKFSNYQANAIVQDSILYDEGKPIVTITSLFATWWRITVRDSESWLSGTQQTIYYKWNQTQSCEPDQSAYKQTNITYSEWTISNVTATIDPPASNGNNFYLCIFSWIVDRAGNTSDTTISDSSITITDNTAPTCVITQAACTSTNLKLTLTASENINAPTWWELLTSPQFTYIKNVTNNNPITVNIQDAVGNQGSCSIEPTNHDNTGPDFEFNNWSWNECTAWSLSITDAYDTWCATTLAAKPYKFWEWLWWTTATYNISAQQPQTITVTWNVKDSLENISTKIATYTIKNVIPTANNFATWWIWNSARNITLAQFIAASSATEWNCGAWSLSFSWVKTNGTKWTCSINSNTLTYTPSAWKVGDDTCVITIKDNENSVVDVTVTFKDIDTESATITITQPPMNYCTNTWKIVSATINENGTLYYHISTDQTCDNTISPFTLWNQVTFTNESDNWKYVCFKATDTALNESYKISAMITGIDTISPSIASLTFTNNGNTESISNWDLKTIYECETWTITVQNINVEWCAWLMANHIYGWTPIFSTNYWTDISNYWNNNSYSVHSNSVTTTPTTIYIGVTDILWQHTTQTVRVKRANMALSWISSYTIPPLTEQTTISYDELIDYFEIHWQWDCEEITISVESCTSDVTGNYVWSNLIITPNEGIDSDNSYCRIKFDDGDNPIRGTLYFPVKTKLYYVTLKHEQWYSSGRVKYDWPGSFDTGLVTLKLTSGDTSTYIAPEWYSPDSTDWYEITFIWHDQEKSNPLYFQKQARFESMPLDIELTGIRIDKLDEKYDWKCQSWTFIIVFDTWFIKDPAWIAWKKTNIATNNIYKSWPVLYASWTNKDNIEWYTIEVLKENLVAWNVTGIIYSTKTIDLNNIECTWDYATCPWFSCSGHTLIYWWEVAAGDNHIPNDGVPYKYKYIFQLDPMVNSWPYEWIFSGDRIIRHDCRIQLKSGNCWEFTTINLLIRTRPYKFWPIKREYFYEDTIWNAVNAWSGDYWFFMYMSNPQEINLWWKTWILWNIEYDINFSSWVADEFYTIQWTGIVNWYQQNLEIKRPTFNYSNPRGYLFNFPYYD